MAATGRLPITRERIEKHYLKQLREITKGLSGVIEAMNDAGINEVEVMNQPAADKGLEAFARLVGSCKTNIAKAALEKSSNNS